MASVDFNQVAPIIAGLSRSGNYLKPAEVSTQLISAAGLKAGIKNIKPNVKAIAGPALYQQLKASTMILISNGLRATAAVLDESGILMTNYHVLEMFGDTARKSDQPLFAMDSTGSFYPVEKILAASKLNDVAIFQVGRLEGKKLFPLPIGNTLPEGSEVYVMGHPAHITYFFSKGIVAKNFVRKERLPNGEEDFRMAITADYSLGMSGGPITDEKGNLAGMVSAATALYGNPRQQVNPQMSFKNAIPIIAVKNLLK